MRSWIVGLGAFLVGCGPSVAVEPSGDESTGGAGSSTSTTTTTTTSTSTSTSSTTSTSTSTSGVETGGSTSSSSGEAEETTGGCSCEGTRIGLDDEVDEGYTPAELLAGTAFSIDGLIWVAIADDPQAMATGGTAYRGGPVVDEVGGCCGSFICAPCPEGVTIGTVALSLATTDGRLDDVFLGSLTGYALGGFEMTIDDVPIASLSGTLGNDTFDLDGTPFTPTTVSLLVRWNDDYTLERIWVFGSDGLDGDLIGRYDAD